MAFHPPRQWLLPPDNPQLDVSDPLNRSLYAWWPFQDLTGADLTGLHRTTLYNAPPLVKGHVGRALAFDGSTQFALYDLFGNVFPTYPMTMNCWINATSYANEECAMVVTNNSTYNAIGLFIEPGGNIKLFSAGGGPDSTVTSTTNNLLAGQWAMISAICGSSTDRRLYINGILAGQDTVDHTPANLNQVIVGRLGGQWGAVLYFPGIIDEPRVWTRALRPSELGRLYADGSAGLRRPARPIQPPQLISKTITLQSASATVYW